MRVATKAWLLNIISIGVGTAALLFSFVASYVIMQESIEILQSMSIDVNMFIIASLGMGLSLLWLNSMLIDSVSWTVARYWYTTKGVDHE
jgi:hypothetical protein